MQDYYSPIGLAAVGAVVFFIGLYFAKQERDAQR
jgi:hypothetical protein